MSEPEPSNQPVAENPAEAAEPTDQTTASKAAPAATGTAASGETGQLPALLPASHWTELVEVRNPQNLKSLYDSIEG